MRIAELPKPKFVVYIWSNLEGGHWLRGPWYFDEDLARTQVSFHENRGRAATYEREDPKP
jgi:hypothetical protein